jgi:hypothetical protein
MRDRAEPAHRAVNVVPTLSAHLHMRRRNAGAPSTTTVLPAKLAFRASVHPLATRTATARVASSAQRGSAALACPTVNAVPERQRLARPGPALASLRPTASQDRGVWASRSRLCRRVSAAFADPVPTARRDRHASMECAVRARPSRTATHSWARRLFPPALFQCLGLFASMACAPPALPIASVVAGRPVSKARAVPVRQMASAGRMDNARVARARA